jgi:hypothetical protein
MADKADSKPAGTQRGASGPGADVGRGEPPVPAQMRVGGAPAVGALTRVVMAATTARCSRSVWSRHALHHSARLAAAGRTGQRGSAQEA